MVAMTTLADPHSPYPINHILLCTPYTVLLYHMGELYNQWEQFCIQMDVNIKFHSFILVHSVFIAMGDVVQNISAQLYTQEMDDVISLYTTKCYTTLWCIVHI